LFKRRRERKLAYKRQGPWVNGKSSSETGRRKKMGENYIYCIQEGVVDFKGLGRDNKKSKPHHLNRTTKDSREKRCVRKATFLRGRETKV